MFLIHLPKRKKYQTCHCSSILFWDVFKLLSIIHSVLFYSHISFKVYFIKSLFEREKRRVCILWVNHPNRSYYHWPVQKFEVWLRKCNWEKWIGYTLLKPMIRLRNCWYNVITSLLIDGHLYILNLWLLHKYNTDHIQKVSKDVKENILLWTFVQIKTLGKAKVEIQISDAQNWQITKKSNRNILI